MSRFAAELCISGCGTIGPFGVGMAALRTALAAGIPLARPIEKGSGWHRSGGSGSAALVPAVDLKAMVPPAAARRMSTSSLWAVAAAKLALADAGVDVTRLQETALTVDLANVFGPSRYTELLLQQVLHGDPQLASPFLFTDCVANAPAGQIAIALGARGSNTTWCERECGQVLALLAAARPARDAAPRRALCGVVDEMPEVVHAILDRLNALVAAATAGGEVPRPYGRTRAGFLAGEGATVLLLEPRSLARRPLARVVAGGRAFDPSAHPIGWGSGHVELAGAIAADLAQAGVAPGSIGAVVASASGSVGGDALEARVLRELFDAALPPVLVPKGVVGEFGGGVLASALLALEGAQFARPVGCDDGDPELGLRVHDGTVRAERVLVTTFAAGGAAAWVVLEAGPGASKS